MSTRYGSYETAWSRLKRWRESFRRIIIGYERLAITYKAFINIASTIIHLRYGI